MLIFQVLNRLVRELGIDANTVLAQAVFTSVFKLQASHPPIQAQKEAFVFFRSAVQLFVSSCLVETYSGR